MGLFDAGKTLELKVEGMTCGHCQARVEGALQKAPGVKKAQVDLAAGRATVTYDPARTDPGALQKAVADVGYDASPVA